MAAKEQTMARTEVVGMNVALTELGELKEGGIKFAYALARNKTFIKDEIEAIEKASTAPEKFLEYEQKRIQLCTEHCDKKADGSPSVTPQGVFVIRENRTTFDDALEVLREECKEELDVYEEWKDGLETFMKEQVPVKVHRVKLTEFPAESITPNQLERLMPMILDGVDDPPPKKKKVKKDEDEDAPTEKKAVVDEDDGDED